MRINRIYSTYYYYYKETIKWLNLKVLKKTNIQAHGNVTDDLHKDNENSITSSNSTTNTSTQAKSAKKSTQTANNSNTDNENNAISLNNTKTKSKIGNKSIELPDGTSIDNENNATASNNTKAKPKNSQKPTPQECADLAADAYNNRGFNEMMLNIPVKIGDSKFRIIDSQSNPETGYQGRAYQNIETNQIIIAHRGTENWDDWVTNGGMFVKNTNRQEKDADELTNRVMKKADRFHKEHPDLPKPEITHTGHSLGGTITQIMTYKHGHEGTTFNAYGAASLKDIPKGGEKVTNYVMATDMISAASPHYGKEIILSERDDISKLKLNFYNNSYNTLAGTKAIPLGVGEINDAHGINNFTGSNSILSEKNYEPAIQLTKANEKMVQDHRNHVGSQIGFIRPDKETPSSQYNKYNKIIAQPLPKDASREELIRYGFAALKAEDGSQREEAINSLLASDIGKKMQLRIEQNASTLERERKN